MEYKHQPVLLEETLEYMKIKPDGVYIDATAGGGGHSAGIYERLGKKGKLLAIDLDREALTAAKERLGKLEPAAELILIQGNFADLEAICEQAGITGADGILFDIGVSSYQLDNPERGFSYKHDGRLDMRMDTRSGKDAYTVVNTYSLGELTGIIRKYGEEKWASRIAKFIVEERERGRIETTGELAEIIKNAIPASARRKGPHPAKRTFQAIRIEVNGEITNLERALDSAIRILNPGGRVCVITFHSLEDRVVKNKFREFSKWCSCPAEAAICTCNKKPAVKRITGKPVVPDEKEMEDNPKARSAKLRVAEKLPI